MGRAWEEPHPHSQKQIFQKTTLPIKLYAPNFVPHNSYWREGSFQNLCGLGPSEHLLENG